MDSAVTDVAELYRQDSSDLVRMDHDVDSCGTGMNHCPA